MKAYFNATIMAVALLASGHAQNAADDPGGWTKAKWGMTAAQVKAAYPEAAMIEDPRVTRLNAAYPGTLKNVPLFLGIRGYAVNSSSVGPSMYTVTFFFGKDDHLNGVMFDPELGERNDTAVELAHFTLLTLLTNNYDKPTQSSEDKIQNGVDHKWQWIFPTTVIELHYAVFKHEYETRDSFNQVNLLYTERRKESGL
jgi:hypothetical protein